MTEEQISQREAEWRGKYPDIFNHPGQLPGEVWVGDQPAEMAHLTASDYRRNGFPSTRVGKEVVMLPVEGCNAIFAGFSIFMDLRELIVAREQDNG